MSKYDNSDSRTGRTGMSFLGVLQLIFIVLKLLNLIDWSWPVVLIPLWIDLGLLGIIVVIATIMYFLD